MDDADLAERERRRHARRALSFAPNPDGSVELRGTLPPELFANFLRCLEHREETLFGPGAGDGRTTPAQRRADALVAMAEASLVGGDADVGTAERFQVVAHVDAEALEASAHEAAEKARDPAADPGAPLALPLRAAIAGFLGGGITPATARRLACDGSLVTMILKNGEPIAVGRKTRTVSPATRRAVLARDGHRCTFPGCGNVRGLDVHHTLEWRYGGRSDSEVLATVCRGCHTRVHDEGWRVRRADEAAPPSRHPEADALLADADPATVALTRRLDARRPAFRYERLSVPAPPARSP